MFAKEIFFPDLLLSNSTILGYPGQHADKDRASIYETGTETTVMMHDRCVEECQMQEPPTLNQSTCFAAVPGHKY